MKSETGPRAGPGQAIQTADVIAGCAMKMQEIRKIGKNWGADCSIVRSKQDLIRDIQIREGFSPCFHTKETCEEDCMWKPDCLRYEKPVRR